MITQKPFFRKWLTFRYLKKALKRLVPLALVIYLSTIWPIVGIVAGIFFLGGLLDVLRNSTRNLSTFDRYFAGNGVLTWVLSPVNLFLDFLCLPYWNKGVYRLDQLPQGHQAEIQKLIEAAHSRNLIQMLESKMEGKKRGMIFFKWYGKNIPTSVDMPEYHEKYKYIRTIGVSIFNKRSSTGLHYGPLRITLRVLYNINTIEDPNVYIQVGHHVHRWKDQKLFIFDDTLQHKSINESDGMRYCLFVDMLRPAPVPFILDVILTGVRLIMTPFRAIFYGHWSFIK
ncbi:MAG: aspartyl/asparaginyl beta-hydroxylase domain-containing protein [Gemmataceae bacterium]|jgi:beta-hydroxylase|nr:aspartyl/asparaginyl beta-hydroxylase domain-containing protein [Gemmataceae bacterium]